MRPLLALALVLLLPASTLAQSVRSDVPAADEPAVSLEPPSSDVTAQVSPPATPTIVEVGVTVIALNRISAPNEPFPTFDATLMLTARWLDPRLAFDAEQEGDDRRVYTGSEAAEVFQDHWWPDLAIENEDGERSVDARTLVVRSDGGVTYEEIFDGRFRTRFDLRAFPFDVQSLPLVVESSAWNARNVQLRPMADRIRSDASAAGHDWSIENVTSEVAEVMEVRSRRPFSALTINIEARRHPGFYLGKVMLPLLLIVAFTWTTFWMTGEAASARLQRGFIALLSVVAFTQVIANHLPRISYITFLDGVMYLAFASTGATLLQIIATHRAEQRGRKELSARLDRIAQVAFPAGFGVALLALYLIHS
jgi:hypothetical protein